MDIMRMGSNPNFLGSWDLDELPGHKIALTIREIRDEKIPNGQGKEEVETVCYFVEDVKPMILNVTNKKTLVKLHKTKDTERLRGKRILVQIKQVKAFGDIYDALRIAPTIPAETKAPAIKCPRCGKPVEAAFGMKPEELIKYTKKKYGAEICAECAKKEAESKKGDEIHE